MKVAMLGWEYPPHISGGLGTACQGLTRALAPLDVEIDFFVPRLYGDEDAPHMRLMDLAGETAVTIRKRRAAAGRRGEPITVAGGAPVEQLLISPYTSAQEYLQLLQKLGEQEVLAVAADAGIALPEPDVEEVVTTTRPVSTASVQRAPAASDNHYGTDLYAEVARFAGLVRGLTEDTRYDLVHAHDWMSFPAGAALANAVGAPLVLHVHSLEYDRSGEGGNERIVAIERAGLQRADAIVAVSHYTKGLIQRLHGIDPERIHVVHNGVYAPPTIAAYRRESEFPGPVVLFLGRVTFQKGPEYFVAAAAKVAARVPDAHFVVAGSGDMLSRVQAQVAELGLDSRFHFPGFVRGAEVERLFSIADVYVMPSVSEPFGLTALEAMSYETPVVLSRQSGAAEVLRHALKIDFWDVDRLAERIESLLRYPELRESIVAMAREDVKRIHWDAAAQRVSELYQRMTGDPRAA